MSLLSPDASGVRNRGSVLPLRRDPVPAGLAIRRAALEAVPGRLSLPRRDPGARGRFGHALADEAVAGRGAHLGPAGHLLSDDARYPRGDKDEASDERSMARTYPAIVSSSSLRRGMPWLVSQEGHSSRPTEAQAPIGTVPEQRHRRLGATGWGPRATVREPNRPSARRSRPRPRPHERYKEASDKGFRKDST
jgi:hypothetical protein